MVYPHGFEHFCTYLQGLEQHCVIIGGGAATILMSDDGLEFRSTKDVDLLIISRSDELNSRICSYLKNNDYKTREATQNAPRYYRFSNPTSRECPRIIEVFAGNELNLDLADGQHIIPISNTHTTERLSAILLDDEYFELIKQNRFISAGGVPIINAIANICLKARAHRDLHERRERGDTSIDRRDIQKHLSDIWRLAINLKDSDAVAIDGQPLKDIEAAIRKLEALPKDQFKQVMANNPGMSFEAIMATLKKTFLLT